MSFFKYAYLILAFAAMPLLASAQQNTRPDPADPAWRVPAVQYQSVFENYEASSAEPLALWREVNDEVSGAVSDAGHQSPSATAGVPPTAIPSSGAPSNPSP